jgi:hypothetical protein
MRLFVISGLGIALSAAGLAAGGAFALAPAAEAAESCGSPKIVSAAYLRRFGGTPVVGSIQLKRDSCHRYWGELYMYEPMPANTFATAYLTRFGGSGAESTFSCDSDGGTGRVRKGDTRCRTPKITGSDGDFTFVASGHEYHGGSGWAKVSWGQTARTR